MTSYKKILFILSLFLVLHSYAFSQTHINQNGVNTSVVVGLKANNLQAKRYEIAAVGYNSYHWQVGGIIVVELFQDYWETGYDKYFIEIGFGQGANSGEPRVKLIESQGQSHYSKLSLGTPSSLSSDIGGYANKSIPIYVDVRYYGSCRARITYMQDRVDAVNYCTQIKINENPAGTDISDFNVPLADLQVVEGRVGIGTANPRQTLDVKGGIGFANMNSNDKQLYSPADGILEWMTHNNAGEHAFAVSHQGQKAVYLNTSGNSYLNGGNVGIGTANPDSKLTVVGKVHAKEVKVSVMDGADFVFDKNYNLKPLNEVESYIQENKHLPEIASAQQMKTEGLELGEMNIKLLQKIEELTLHMIEFNKEVESLKKQNKDLNDKLEQLQSTKK